MIKYKVYSKGKLLHTSYSANYNDYGEITSSIADIIKRDLKFYKNSPSKLDLIKIYVLGELYKEVIF